ncbi:MAG: PqqD family protein [Planctomycetes bacterium]|nr:PqqD family protein [Planctomycetota bacterium]
MAEAPPPPLTLDTVVRHGEEILYRDLDGEAVLVDLRSGHYFGLDPVGTRIWIALERPAPLRRALDTVLAEFEVAEEVAGPDLLRLAGELLGRGLLVRDAGGAPAGGPGSR